MTVLGAVEPEDTGHPGRPMHTRLGPLGAVLSVLGLFALLFGTIQGPEDGWASPPWCPPA